MLKKILIVFIFMLLNYRIFIIPDFMMIAAGVAIFLSGMMWLGDGFKAFSGGVLEMVLEKSTDKTWKSLLFGAVSTTFMQSSSLVSVLTISFITADLIGLAQGIGIIFGANIGTTTGAWLMAGLGLKVHISSYAMPMLIIGVFFIFQKAKSIKGIGYILAGLGFLFLGIHYMKEGFEAFKDTIDLSAYAMTGIGGLVVFTGIGVIATVVMQSSHATLMLILAALAAGQITYDNGLALAIGANVGTTVTAIIGSMSSNIAGKRLAGAHLIFNMITGFIAIIFMQQIMLSVDWISNIVGISNDDYTLKLAVFHTIFNIIGVAVMVPFIGLLVTFLERVLKGKDKINSSVDKALYLQKSSLELPSTAIASIILETRHLYENAFDVIIHGFNINKHDVVSNMPFDEVIKHRYSTEGIDIDYFYKMKIKGVYGEIVDFATMAQKNMSKEFNNEVYELKLAARDISKAVKGTKQLQKNLLKYIDSNNEYIRAEYEKIQKSVAELLRYVDLISKSDQEDEILILISKAEKHVNQNDVQLNGDLDTLIREGRITQEMSTSLMNDISYVNGIAENMLNMSRIVFIPGLSHDDTEDYIVDAIIEEKN